MIFVVMGPTGVGKTDLSIYLAKKYNCEIINADSMQVYKGLSIGTAKIKEEEKEGVVHHLLDICDVDRFYTVYDYQKDARKAIEQIQKRGKNVLLVGGTGLYIKAALFDYQFPKETIQKDYSAFSNEELQEKIKKYSPEEVPHVNNRKRLERLLTRLENQTPLSKRGNEPYYDHMIFLYLKAPRDKLYPRLDKRVEKMFEEGLLEEVRPYKDVLSTYKSLQTGIGYKEFIPYFQKEKDLEAVKEDIKKRTRNYAKRQDTFFQNQFSSYVVPVDFEDFNQTIKISCDIIDKALAKKL